jgi:DNA-binding response OmpR family regulator
MAAPNANPILLVDDDPAMRELIARLLEQAGFPTRHASTGEEALAAVGRSRPLLVILDVRLPGVSGYEVHHELRSRFGDDLPIIFISGERVESLDRAGGLLLGADDYVVKPFGVAELMARVKAVLRRRWGDDGQVVRFGEVAVNLTSRSVTRGGAPVDLTAQEFKLLAHLVSNSGRTFSREELLSGAWGIDYEGTPRTVDTFVRQLRQKLEPDPEEPRYILTARGLGYRFERPQV